MQPELMLGEAILPLPPLVAPAPVQPRGFRRVPRTRPAFEGEGLPAFRRQCSCSCWPLMVRVIWWLLSDRR